MLGKLSVKRVASLGQWVDGVINSDLTILVVEPLIDVLAALLQDFLSEQYRLGRGVSEEVILRNVSVFHGSTSIISQVENSSLDAQPADISKDNAVAWDCLPFKISGQRNRDMTLRGQ